MKKKKSKWIIFKEGTEGIKAVEYTKANYTWIKNTASCVILDIATSIKEDF